MEHFCSILVISAATIYLICTIYKLFPIKWFLGCRELSPSFCRRGDMLIIFIFLSLLQFPVLWQDLGWPDWNSRKYISAEIKCVSGGEHTVVMKVSFNFLLCLHISAPSWLQVQYLGPITPYNSYFQFTIELWNFPSWILFHHSG